MSAPATAPADTAGSLRWAWVPADAVAIVVFVLLGARAHDEGGAHLVAVALPFLAGWFAAAGVLRLDRDPYSLRRAALVWPLGVALGLVLRVLFGVGGAPLALVIVSLLTLGLLLLGWRALMLLVRRVRAR